MKREDRLINRRFGTTFAMALRRGKWRINRYDVWSTSWIAPSGREYEYPLLRDLFILLVASKFHPMIAVDA